MPYTAVKCKGSRTAPLEFTADHEIQSFRELSPKEAKERALCALSCLHKGLSELARIILVLGVNPGKDYAYKIGIIASPYGVPVGAEK